MRWPALLRHSIAGGRQAESLSHTDLVQIVLDESGYTAMWQADRSPDAAGRLENLKELVVGDGRVREPRRVSRACQPGHGQCRRIGRRHGQSDDFAQRQGVGVRYSVPARLGGRTVSQSARARRKRPRGTRGGAPARLCRADPCSAPRPHFIRRQSPGAWSMAECDPLALRRRIAARAYRNQRRAGASAGCGGLGVRVGKRGRSAATGADPAARSAVCGDRC